MKHEASLGYMRPSQNENKTKRGQKTKTKQTTAMHHYVWQLVPENLALGRLGQEYTEFEGSKGYTALMDIPIPLATKETEAEGLFYYRNLRPA